MAAFNGSKLAKLKEKELLELSPQKITIERSFYKKLPHYFISGKLGTNLTYVSINTGMSTVVLQQLLRAIGLTCHKLKYFRMDMAVSNRDQDKYRICYGDEFRHLKQLETLYWTFFKCLPEVYLFFKLLPLSSIQKLDYLVSSVVREKFWRLGYSSVFRSKTVNNISIGDFEGPRDPNGTEYIQHLLDYYNITLDG